MTWSAFASNRFSAIGTSRQQSEVTIPQNLSTFGVLSSDPDGRTMTGLAGSTAGWADMRAEYFDGYALDTLGSYSVTVTLEPESTGNSTVIGYGLYMRDGTGKLYWFGTRDLTTTGGNVGVITYTTNSFGGVTDDGTSAVTNAHNIRSFRIRQDTTNRYMDYSFATGGQGPWTTFATRTKTHHLTPNRIGWFAYFGSSGGKVKLTNMKFTR